MKQRLTTVSLQLGLAALCGLAFIAGGYFAASTAAAQAQSPFPRIRECTQGTIKGRYGALITGQFLANNPLGIPAGTPYSSRLIYNFDGYGRGQVEGSQITAFAGAFVPGGPNELTYKVKADCTWEDEVNYDNLAPGLRSPAYGVIVAGGEEIMGTTVLNGVLEGSIVAKRID